MQLLNNDKEQNDQPKKQLRLPLLLRVSVIVLLLFGLTVGTAGSFFSAKLKSHFLAEKLRSGEDILAFLASSVKIPILADDTLRLSSLIRDAADMDGIVYAYVVDRNQVVQAYFGRQEIGEKINYLKSGEVVREKKNILIVLTTDPFGEQVYDLSKPILYNEKPLGAVHLGLSGQFIKNGLYAARLSLLKSFLAPGLCLVLTLIIIVYTYFLQSKRKTDRLIRAVNQYRNGNLQYRVEELGNNELGDVALALQAMSQKLSSLEADQDQLEKHLKFSSLARILESPISKGESYAERRQVAVLFAGIKGLGSYAGTEKPEEVVKALNKYLGIVTTVISKHGGYVDKIIGDAVVGIFGVSLYRENHTARAVRAALDLQDVLSRGSKNESQLLSSVCIGISSGIVLSGNIGSHSKVEFSSIGDSIKEAYWLTSLGHAGEIILGKEIYSRMKDSVRVEPLPAQQVPGGPDVIKSFRLVNLTEKENGH